MYTNSHAKFGVVLAMFNLAKIPMCRFSTGPFICRLVIGGMAGFNWFESKIIYIQSHNLQTIKNISDSYMYVVVFTIGIDFFFFFICLFVLFCFVFIILFS